MHFIFIPYGKRSEVELLLRDMDAQKHQLNIAKDGIKKKIWIQGQVRLLPFGIYEYVCPKEDKDKVLHTLDFKSTRYDLKGFIKTILRKIVKCDPIPEYEEDQHYLWLKTNVNIIPLGIREDGDFIDPSGEYKGWEHEAI